MFGSAQKRRYPFCNAAIHIRIGADGDGGHHGRTGGPGLFTGRHADRRADGRRQHLAQGARARRTTRQPQLGRHVAHRGVAVARGHAEPLDDRPDKVGKAMGCGKPDEAGARIGVDEGSAFTGIGNVGMVEDRAGAAAIHPAIDPADEVRVSDRLAGLCQKIAGHAQQPVDVQRRSHVGLHLGDHSGHRKQDDVARPLVV